MNVGDRVYADVIQDGGPNDGEIIGKNAGVITEMDGEYVTVQHDDGSVVSYDSEFVYPEDPS